MKSAILLALLALSATAIELNIPLTSFMKAAPKQTLLSLYNSKHLQSTASSVTWGECNSQHLYDKAVGTNTPQPPVVGSKVFLNLDVLFNADADVKNAYVSVMFSNGGKPAPLYGKDEKLSKAQLFHEGDELIDSISWDIPAFAPIGSYDVQIIVHGADKEKDNYVCLTAAFKINK